VSTCEEKNGKDEKKKDDERCGCFARVRTKGTMN